MHSFKYMLGSSCVLGNFLGAGGESGEISGQKSLSMKSFIPVGKEEDCRQDREGQGTGCGELVSSRKKNKEGDKN